MSDAKKALTLPPHQNRKGRTMKKEKKSKVKSAGSSSTKPLHIYIFWSSAVLYYELLILSCCAKHTHAHTFLWFSLSDIKVQHYAWSRIFLKDNMWMRNTVDWVTNSGTGFIKSQLKFQFSLLELDTSKKKENIMATICLLSWYKILLAL